MRRAFSLVELSIVLVILGLLVGGILTGQSLIRAAELRSVSTEFSQYQTAVMSFRDKYFAFPGDMDNATDFWGAADSSGAGGECSDGGTDSGTGTQTCNGNGDGHVGATASTRWERFRFWQHLANAGMIEGSFSGTQGSAGATHAEVGTNIPAAKIPNAGWNSWATDTSENHRFFIGTQQSSGSAHGEILTPEEAWNIDTKMDDGLPEQGNVQNEKTDCMDSATPKNYALSTTTIECNLLFLNAY